MGDSTKIVLHHDKVSVAYFDDENRQQRFSIHSYPEEMFKKAKLLGYFEKALCRDDNVENRPLIPTDASNEAAYVDSWKRVRFAVIFRLMNGTVQIIFEDDSQLIYKDPSTVVYQDRAGRQTVGSLDEISQSERADVNKRYKLMRHVLESEAIRRTEIV